MTQQRLQLVVLSAIAISSLYSAVSIAEIKSKMRQPVLIREFSSGREPTQINTPSNVDVTPVTKKLDTLQSALDSIESNIRVIEKNVRR